MSRSTSAVRAAEPEPEEEKLLFTVARGGLFHHGAGISYPGQGVYLRRSDGAPFVVRGVLIAPPGFDLAPEEVLAAARTGFEQLEADRLAHGFSEERWLKSRHFSRQIERVHAALAALKEK